MGLWNITEDVARNGRHVLIPWVEFALEPYGGGSKIVYRWSDVGISLPDKFIEAKILDWVRHVRALSDDYGGFENQQFGFRIADVDRTILNLFDDTNYKYFWNRFIGVYLASVSAINLGDTPMTIAGGVLRNIEPGEDRTIDFTVEDTLSTEFSSTYLDELLPRRLISKNWFTNCYDGSVDVDGNQLPAIVGLPEPIIYGRVSDYDLPTAEQRGPVPGLPVGTETIAGNPSWVRVLIAGHACKEIENVYLNGVKVDNSRYGADILCPGKTGWPFGATYRDITGVDSVVRRYTIIYVIGAAANAIVYGTEPLTADVKGVESVGDGSGTLLDNIYDQYYHFLTQFGFQDYQSGNWLATPYYDDLNTIPYVDSASFATAKGFRSTYVGDGVIGANGDRRSKKDWMKAFQNSADARAGFNRFGSLVVTCGEPQSPTNSYDDIDDIIKGGPGETNHDALRNVIPFSFRRDWARGTWRVSNRLCYSPNSIAGYRSRKEDTLREFWFTRPEVIAHDIAKHFLHRKMNPPRRYTFETALHGLRAELGDTISVTDRDAFKNGGLVNQSCMVERVETSVGDGVVRLTVWDYSTMPSFLSVDAVYADAGSSTPGSYSYGTGIVSGGLGGGTTSVVINNLAKLYAPLGGSEHVAPEPASGWSNVVTALPITLDSADYSGKTITVKAWVKTENAGSPVQVRLYNTTTSAQVGISSTSTSTGFVQKTFTVTLTPGVNEYVLQVSNYVSVPVYAYGVIYSN